jgi:heat-inducible transcriptional repressor
VTVAARWLSTKGDHHAYRMAYERVIPIVDITSKLLSNALSHS